MNIAVSILNSSNIGDFLNNLKEIASILEKKKIKDASNISIHLDVMDKKFVPQQGIDINNIKLAKKYGFYTETHLMVKYPIEDKYIDDAIKYGSDEIIIHYEIPNFNTVFEYIYLKSQKQNKYKIGIAINPETNANVLIPYVNKISKILIMSVHPGLGGQSYILETNKKLLKIKESFKGSDIEIDGGINDVTISEPLNIGINNFVIGTFLSKEEKFEKLQDKIIRLNVIKDMWTHDKDRNIEFDKKLLQINEYGYGKNDILIGIKVPSLRNIAKKWYKYLSLSNIDYFLNAKYHEYRQFACYIMSYNMKDAILNNDIERQKDIYEVYHKNLLNINNWDLTDESAPNILGNYLMLFNDKQKLKIIEEYLLSNDIWIKRIGIVSMLKLVMKYSLVDVPLKVCDRTLYYTDDLLQKATGWVLREIYKKDDDLIYNYLCKKNLIKKIPNITLSYAMEKMTDNQKKCIRNK